MAASLVSCVASALAFGLAFPPLEWKPLAWIALAPLLVALRRSGPMASISLAWIWTLVASYVIGDWLPRGAVTYFDQPPLVGMLLFLGVFTLMGAIYYMAFAVAYRGLARRTGLGLPYAVAAVWVSAELGRGRLLTETPFFIGNPWGLIGYSQTDWLPMVQIASVTGVYGVSFALVCANAGIAEVALAAGRGRAALRRALLCATLAALPTAACLVYGAVQLSAAESAPDPTSRVAIVQGNLAVGSRWRDDAYGASLETYLRLTHAIEESAPPEIVFWPESAMTFFVEEEPLYRKSIASVLGLRGTELVAGGVRSVGESDPRYYNSVFVLGPDGEILDRYDKEYLVPFAEYFPLDIDLLRRRFGRVRTFEAGSGSGVVSTRAGPAGVLVCNETMLPEVAGRRVAAGAAYLANPTNDTWIDDLKYTAQQLDMAVMRAIEQRRYLVRASTAGPSAIVDPWGRLRAVSEAPAQAVIVGAISGRSERSVYGMVGDAFALTCLVAAGAALAIARRYRDE